MGHVAEGALRRYLDEPGSLGTVDRDHLGGCARCAATLQAGAQDRDAADFLLAPPVPVGSAQDTDAAWASLNGLLSGPATVQVLGTARPGRRAGGRAGRLLAGRRGPVAAGVAALLVVGGTAAAAANDWLPIFTTEQVAPVSVSMEDVASLATLDADLAAIEAYGDLTEPAGGGPREVPDIAAAEAATGLDVPPVDDLPPGTAGSPSYLVIDRQDASFTFSAAQAAAAGAPAMPPGLDGSTLRIQGGPGVAAVWGQGGERGDAIPAFVVARAKAPTATSQGVSLEVARDYLLSLPGIPEGLAAQLKAVTGDGTTLPIPVLSGEMTSTVTDVDGVEATVLEARGGLGAAVVWVEDGVLTAVGGLVDDDEALAVARGLD